MDTGLRRYDEHFLILSRLRYAQTAALCDLLIALCLPNGQTELNFSSSKHLYFFFDYRIIVMNPQGCGIRDLKNPYCGGAQAS